MLFTSFRWDWILTRIFILIALVTSLACTASPPLDGDAPSATRATTQTSAGARGQRIPVNQTRTSAGAGVTVHEAYVSDAHTTISYTLQPPADGHVEMIGGPDLRYQEHTFAGAGGGGTVGEPMQVRFPALPAGVTQVELEIGPLVVSHASPVTATVSIPEVRASRHTVGVAGHTLRFTKIVTSSKGFEVTYEPVDAESARFILGGPGQGIELADNQGRHYSTASGSIAFEGQSVLASHTLRAGEPLAESATKLHLRAEGTSTITDPLRFQIGVPLSIASSLPTATATPAETATPAPTPVLPTPPPATASDPKAFVVYVLLQQQNDNWAAVRDVLTEPFQAYDTEALQQILGMPTRTGWLDPSQWQVEHHDAFTVVRAKEMPPLAFVLRPTRSGAWRLDPGAYNRALIEARRDGGTGGTGGLSVERNIDTDAPTSEIVNHFREFPYVINVDGNTVQVTFEVTVVRADDARLSLSGLEWHAGNECGHPKIVWTNARRTNDVLTFPMPPDLGNSAIYHLTLQLDGVPADVDEFQLSLNDVVVDDAQFSVDYTIPKEDAP